MPIKQSWLVPPNTEGQTMISFIRSMNPALDKGHILKAAKNKDIRINGQRIRTDMPVASGDEIVCFWPDNLADRLIEASAESKASPKLDRYYQIVYSDEDLIVINKAPGISVHSDRHSQAGEPDLLTMIRNSMQDSRIELCHRLDRNTSGLLLLARTQAVHALLTALIREHSIRKLYQCLAKGLPPDASDDANWHQITGWLEKDADAGNVYIHEKRQPGDKKITTRYRLIRHWPDLGPDGSGISHLEVELVTGRTHQIRAHLAAVGCPLLGDGKYGRNSFNQSFHDSRGRTIKRQQLTASSITLPDLQTLKEAAAGIREHKYTEALLAKLADRSFRIEPDFDIRL
ncbi:MAG: RluA family pseudouridine synthase [Clostridiaceae bacterium]|nr:RluA family pseudouridine synthase [Clostridiaceae bacterium]